MKTIIFSFLILTISLHNLYAEEISKFGKYKREKMFEVNSDNEENKMLGSKPLKGFKKISIWDFIINDNGDVIATGLADDQNHEINMSIFIISPKGDMKNHINTDKIIEIHKSKRKGFYVFNSNKIKYDLYNSKGNLEKEIKINKIKSDKQRRKTIAQLTNNDFSQQRNEFSVVPAGEIEKIKDNNPNNPLGFKIISKKVNRLLIKGLKKYGFLEDELHVNTSYPGRLHDSYPLNIDENRNIYVYVSAYKPKSKNNTGWTYEMLEYFVYVFDKEGNLIDEIPIERHDVERINFEVKQKRPAYYKDDFFITDKGILYRRKTFKNGYEFYRWSKVIN